MTQAVYACYQASRVYPAGAFGEHGPAVYVSPPELVGIALTEEVAEVWRAVKVESARRTTELVPLVQVLR